MTKSRKTSRDLQAERTRAHILETALRLFVERGISSTSTRRIAREAGVSEGLIFHHFPKKRDLIAGIRQGRKDPFSELLEQIMNQSDDVPVAVVVRAISTHFVEILGSSSVEGRLFQILIGESRTDPELGAMFQASSSQGSKAIGDYLRTRIEAGELRPDLNCDAAAMSLLGSFVWFFVSSRHESEDEWTAAATIYAQQVVDLWLRGALRTPTASP